MTSKFQQQRNRLLLGNDGNALVALLAINVIMFGLINFIKIGYYLGDVNMAAFYKNILHWFILPPDAGKLLGRPWTFLTYMFTHEDVWRLISNMLWLWAFGFILQDLTGNRLLGPIYLYAGLAGGFLFLLVVNLFPVLSAQIPATWPLEGAGASVMGVAVATTFLAPSYRIFPMLNGGIPLWILTLIFALIDFASIASSGAGVGVAHLAGGALGWLFISRYRSGHDWGLWMHQAYEWFLHLFEPKPNAQKPGNDTKQQVFYQQGQQKPFKKTSHLTQQRVDELLDKINQKGYHFLSDEEKEYLKRASKEEL